MKGTTHLMTCAHSAARSGDWEAAHYVLRWYGDMKHWTSETFRARWDGAASLLDWWHEREPALRPPLDRLTKEDAQTFLAWLEARGLSRLTIKGYRVGARALTKALRGASTSPTNLDTNYDPFREVSLSPLKRPQPWTDIDPAAIETLTPRQRDRLELLLALLASGLSVPEACTRCWRHVQMRERRVVGYHHRTVRLNAAAVTALERLGEGVSEADWRGEVRLVGWSPATARRWLKRGSASL